LYTNGDNHENVYQIAKILNIQKSDVDHIIKNFKGLEGRQEFVVKIQDRDFVCDTCATHPDANLYALKTFQSPILI